MKTINFMLMSDSFYNNYLLMALAAIGDCLWAIAHFEPLEARGFDEWPVT
jgi:hypothetical protein